MAILFHKSVKYDRPGECSLEKDCLSVWQPQRKSSSESSALWIVSGCYKSLVIGLIDSRSHDVICRKLWKITDNIPLEGFCDSPSAFVIFVDFHVIKKQDTVYSAQDAIGVDL